MPPMPNTMARRQQDNDRPARMLRVWMRDVLFSILLAMFIVTFLFGAKKLPELARGMGQAVREFSKAKDEVTRPPQPPAPPAISE